MFLNGDDDQCSYSPNVNIHPSLTRMADGPVALSFHKFTSSSCKDQSITLSKPQCGFADCAVLELMTLCNDITDLTFELSTGLHILIICSLMVCICSYF